MNNWSKIALLMVSSMQVAFAQSPLGQFDQHTNIGDVKYPGTVTYNEQQQIYTITGSGANIWSVQDEFHFVWKRMRGDFILRTKANFLSDGVDPHRKIGWMVRAGLEPNAPYVDATVHGDGLTSLQFRRSQGGETEQIESSVSKADIIQLARKGNAYTMSVARFGDTFTNTGTEIDLGDEVLVGLFVCSHNADVKEMAAFQNVRIIVPAPDDFVPYQDYIGSNLEILDIDTGHRRIVHQESDSLQAPNWTRDNRALIYNRNGLLYRFDLLSNTPTQLNTGFATQNNNDHVLSFDGRMLGISHHDPEHNGRSIIYTLPVRGGTPEQITRYGPSYLHGWSPDGKFLVYTGDRYGNIDIYKILSTGGVEDRLTYTQGVDDGPEFTPDGSTIYFNSMRKGLMQIWRMDPDGKNQIQVTDDRFNNWFPHISPNQKSIVFLSYDRKVDPGDHPFYKQVYIRHMPFIGGQPRVIAYVYGGQGTINVPSWSPDNRSIAFVSNTQR